MKRIPVGRVTTYGEVARLAGRPGAARAVGNVMREAHRPGLPYHRVIAAGGQLGGYSNLALKRSLLVAEGLVVTSRRVRHSPTFAGPENGPNPNPIEPSTHVFLGVVNLSGHGVV